MSLAAPPSASRRSPLPAGEPAHVLEKVRRTLGRPLPHVGAGATEALHRLHQATAEHGLDLTHPMAAAHLQPPVLQVGVDADRLASTGNDSLDTYDSGPAAIAVEQWLVAGLTELAGLPQGSDGVMTPGGSMSNLLALLLARDATASRRGLDLRHHGVASLVRPTVLCSELAHFSVHRACSTLGLGEDAVVPVPTDPHQRMRVDALADLLERDDHTPVAVVATAGTTDHGAVDPLSEVAALCRAHDVWCHVDAAYGFGALFSERLRHLLDGLAGADSVTLDLHKLGWVPAAASMLLVSDPAAFAATERTVDYLLSDDDVAAGLAGTLGRSLQTTRRADCLKAAAVLMAHGVDGLGRLVERCHDLAVRAQRSVEADPRLELVAPARLSTVLFRCLGATGADADALQARVRRRLLVEGRALLGRTTVHIDGSSRVVLKLTLLNPTLEPADVTALLDLVAETAAREAADLVTEEVPA